MIRQSYAFEIITPCFCGGAQPDMEAEIRAPSIRGQLRWWFRLLGGFRSLASMPIRDQEAMIFGSAAGEEGKAGRLMTRVNEINAPQIVVDDEGMGAGQGTEKGYLLFSLRPEKKNTPDEKRRDRAVVMTIDAKSPFPSFRLHLQSSGAALMTEDIHALVTVFGSIGALGFRSRRAMGSLRLVHTPLSLREALTRFLKPAAVTVFAQNADSNDDSIKKLGAWLRSWRAHGRTGKNMLEYSSYPGFGRAQSDHNARDYHSGPGYRAALGMPLLTKYGNWNTECPPPGKLTKGRFASPVLLRPHLEGNHWRALVIFVDAMKWPSGPKTKRPLQVYLDRAARDVSLDLYDAMKKSLADSAKAGGPWNMFP